MAKFTFKYDPAETGLRAIGNGNRSSYIKLKGKLCGRIYAPNWNSKDNLYRASFQVHDTEAYCGWRWITLKHKDESGTSLRKWLQDNTDELVSKLTLRLQEER